MGQQEAFESILASLQRAMLDESHWPRTCTLIEKACGAKGTSLMLGEGPVDDVQASFVGSYHRGERQEEAEREYIEEYHSKDEKVPRFRQLPFNQLVRIADLYTEEELKTSPAYQHQIDTIGADSLGVRLDGPNGYSHVSWFVFDPVESGGWGRDQIALVERLAPHVAQLVSVRRAVVSAGALGSPLAQLMEVQRLGIICLDSRGRIVTANGRAGDILRRGDVLSDLKGELRVRNAEERSRFQRMLAAALPRNGDARVGGSMTLGRAFGLPRYVVHVKSSYSVESDFGGHGPGALVLIVEPGRPTNVDAGLVATALGLTPAESTVASRLAEGMTVGEIAEATGRRERSVYWLLGRIYAKLGIRRQVDLVRLVLASTELG
ncbi:MAG: helix-turn-helix transcriptional regulator [Holophagales bacterium]|nr:helix-turn-helix transcriptional regulator [Holophagales bacterium]MYF95893.1 helix-turn-helix transcriptional regulator [Holophagales bacterium]